MPPIYITDLQSEELGMVTGQNYNMNNMFQFKIIPFRDIYY